MIIVKLEGGLGNQMFQYSIGRHLSMHYKTAFKVDCNIYNKKIIANDSITSRSYQLDAFSLEIEKASEKDIHFFTQKKNLSQRLIKAISKTRTIEEPLFAFQQDFIKYGPNCYLNGYWQSELYFKEISEIIRQGFSFRLPLVKENFNIAEKIVMANSVSIHIRRGDYLNNPATNEFHGLCSIEYYQKAIKLIKEKVDNPHFFLFSDDLDWVQKNFILNEQLTIVDINNDSNASSDMHLMSLCKHNIIANSSFSWWGAWLNNNDNKIVIGPKKWFNNPSINTATILAENWYKI